MPPSSRAGRSPRSAPHRAASRKSPSLVLAPALLAGLSFLSLPEGSGIVRPAWRAGALRAETRLDSTALATLESPRRLRHPPGSDQDGAGPLGAGAPAGEVRRARLHHRPAPGDARPGAGPARAPPRPRPPADAPRPDAQRAHRGGARR